MFKTGNKINVIFENNFRQCQYLTSGKVYEGTVLQDEIKDTNLVVCQIDTDPEAKGYNQFTVIRVSTKISIRGVNCFHTRVPWKIVE